MLPLTPKHRPEDRAIKAPRASLVLRLDRAAGDLNPFLLVVTIGLLLLNVTLCLGLAVSQHRFAWPPPTQQTGMESAAPQSAPADWQAVSGEHR
jgi:hypothetical protein